MLKLTIKGTSDEARAALNLHNVAPIALDERHSPFVEGLVTCDVLAIDTEANRGAAHKWFGEGDELIGRGVGFPAGTLFYFSTMGAL